MFIVTEPEATGHEGAVLALLPAIPAIMYQIKHTIWTAALQQYMSDRFQHAWTPADPQIRGHMTAHGWKSQPLFNAN
jgi:hypothetical protein